MHPRTKVLIPSNAKYDTEPSGYCSVRPEGPTAFFTILNVVLDVYPVKETHLR